MTRRALVCGGRDFSDAELLYRTLDAEHALCEITTVIHGGAPGADRLASAWAYERNIPVDLYAADWRHHGAGAGPRRNARMLAEGKPHVVIAFSGGKGTADMKAQAMRADVRVIEVKP